MNALLRVGTIEMTLICYLGAYTSNITNSLQNNIRASKLHTQA